MHMNENKGLILVFLTAIISGFSIFVNSYGVKEFDSSIFAFMKNSIVAVLMFSVIILAGNFSEFRKLKEKQWSRLMAIGLIGGSIPFLMFFKGMQLTTGTTSSFMHKTIFIYASALAVVFLKEKLNWKIILASLLLVFGNYLFIKPDFIFSISHLLVFGAVILWACEYAYSKHVLKELSGNVVAFGRMFFGSLFILIFLFITGKTSKFSMLGPNHFMWLSITSAFLLLYVMTFYNGLKHVKLSTAACILSLGAPITTVLGFIFQDKPLGVMQGFGILLIAAGAVFAVLYSKESSKLALGQEQHGRN